MTTQTTPRYEILEGSTKQALEKTVSIYLAAGYQLQGGASYFYAKEENGNGDVQYLTQYTQAVVML